MENYVWSGGRLYVEAWQADSAIRIVVFDSDLLKWSHTSAVFPMPIPMMSVDDNETLIACTNEKYTCDFEFDRVNLK